MYYCEKCNLKTSENVCSKCGRKNLREIRDDDYCLFDSLPAFKAQIFESNLKESEIPVASFGYGFDYGTKKSANYNIFIPYGYFERATEIYNLLFK